MTAAVKEKSKFCLFVRREIDDYGLDPYKIWIYTWTTRRAINGEAWGRIGNKTRAAHIGLSRAQKTLRLLNLTEITQ